MRQPLAPSAKAWPTSIEPSRLLPLPPTPPRIGCDRVAMAARLHHDVGVQAAVGGVGAVDAHVLAAQVVAAGAQVLHAAGEAVDARIAIELADVEAGAHSSAWPADRCRPGSR
jgi:hypothetical protein